MTFNKLTTWFIILFPYFGFALTGCDNQSKPDGFPKIYPVTITVTQEGKPFPDAQISLEPADGSKNWSVGGKSDQAGKVILRTYGKFDGAPLGKYKVVILKEINEGMDTYYEALNRGDNNAASKVNVSIFSLVEAKYNSALTTPIEIEITPNQKTFEIDAGSAVKEPRKFVR
jgi:hypothetical protein